MPRACSVSQLEAISQRLRHRILTMIFKAGSGHPAGSLSSLEILVSLYFGGILKYDSRQPDWEERDRLIISCGHIAPAVYAVLAEANFFSKKKLGSFRSLNSYLQGHIYHRVPGVEYSSGSLGQGLSVAVGLALGLRGTISRIFCLMSDGEQQEGQIWEAAMTAAKYKLDNLVAIVDANKIQIDGLVEEIMPLGNLKMKYEAFGWKVLEVDGNDFRELIPALSQAVEFKHQPVVLVANTLAGKGVPFMEGDPSWHGRGLTEKEYKQALHELKI